MYGNWQQGGRLEVRYLDRDATIAPNAQIVTSNLTTGIPPGSTRRRRRPTRRRTCRLISLTRGHRPSQLRRPRIGDDHPHQSAAVTLSQVPGWPVAGCRLGPGGTWPRSDARRVAWLDGHGIEIPCWATLRATKSAARTECHGRVNHASLGPGPGRGRTSSLHCGAQPPISIGGPGRQATTPRPSPGPRPARPPR